VKSPIVNGCHQFLLIGQLLPHNMESGGNMNSEAIRELLARRPFEPFEIRLTNGDVHAVKHAECVAISKSRVVIVDPDADRIAIVALLHVA
jgi:hypothetical protein